MRFSRNLSNPASYRHYYPQFLPHNYLPFTQPERNVLFMAGGHYFFSSGREREREKERTGSSEDTYDVNFNSESKCRKQFAGTVAAKINALKGRDDFPYRGERVS